MAGFITFTETGDTGKTKVFDVTNGSAHILGKVKWFAPWRRYCFFPNADCVFDMNCLNVIIDHIDELMAERKIR
jgi:hypothetical protein